MRRSRSSSPRLLLGALLTAVLALGFLAPAADAATARTVSLSSSASGVLAKGKVTFSGVLSRSRRGSAVILQRRSGGRWVAVKTTTTTTSRGTWSVRVALPSKVGRYSFRAVAPKRGALRAATSAVVKVAAQRRPKVTLKASPRTVNAGSATTFSGAVTPGVRNGTVAIQRLDGRKWVTAQTTKVGARGAFKVRVPVTVSSVFRAVSGRIGLNAPGTSLNVVVITNPVIATSALPTAYVGGDYSAALKAVGGIEGTWTVSGLSGTGLTLDADTGVITGTPVSAATGEHDLTVGFTQAISGQKAPSKTVTLAVVQPVRPVITTSSLEDGLVGRPYRQTLSATTAGNPATGTWSASQLPPGLSLAPGTGVISGTPTTAGTTGFTVGFVENGNPLAANTRNLSIKISVPPPPTITTTSLPDGAAAQAYSTTLAAGGATGTWSASPLPAGLALNPATGVISGTPTTAGSTQVTIGFTEAGNPTAATPKVLVLKVLPVITTSSLPNAKLAVHYSAQLHVAGASTGTWTVSGLPSGLKCDKTTGLISGTVLLAQLRAYTVTVNFTGGGVAATPKTLTITVTR